MPVSCECVSVEKCQKRKWSTDLKQYILVSNLGTAWVFNSMFFSPIQALHDYQPEENDSGTMPAWLEVMGQAHLNLSR